MWETGYSKDPESSSESWCLWIFTEQSSLPFFTFTFVFIFFANLPAHPAWARASVGGGGWAGEAPLICFQDACSLGPGTELQAQGTGERNLNLELSPNGEQETRNKVESPVRLLWSPVEVIRIALSLPGTCASRASSASESRLTAAGPPPLEQHLGRGGFPLKLNMFLRCMKKKSVFPTFNLLFLSLLGSKPPVRRND